jgi:cytochrome c biogenesis protein CcdA
VLHGSAGSAAVLALLPLAQFRNGLESAVYLVFFSAGVAAGALAFAHVFARCFASAAASGERLSAALRGAIGVLAIASGAWLFIEITHGGG